MKWSVLINKLEKKVKLYLHITIKIYMIKYIKKFRRALRDRILTPTITIIILLLTTSITISSF